MISQLPFHPIPNAKEGLHGFLLRLAEGNGCNGIKFLCGNKPVSSEVLIQWLGLKTDRRLVRILTQLSYSKMTYRPLWNYKSSRYCPECLKGRQIWRQEWELTLFTVCPIHKCYLIETCTDCGKQLTWKRRQLLFCDCGAQLQAAKAAGAEEAETLLATTISSKLAGEGYKLTQH